MKQKKSAKDQAFEKEKEKYRSEIRKLTCQISDQKREIHRLTDVMQAQEQEIEQLKDWVRRLLEYTEMDETDMRLLIDKEKRKNEILQTLKRYDEVISNIFPVR